MNKRFNDRSALTSARLLSAAIVAGALASSGAAWAQGSVNRPLAPASGLRPARGDVVSSRIARITTPDGKCGVDAPVSWYLATQPNSLHFSPPLPAGAPTNANASLIIQSQPAANFDSAVQSDKQKGQAPALGGFTVITATADRFIAKAGPNVGGFVFFYAEARSATVLCHAWWNFSPEAQPATFKPDQVGVLKSITPAP